MELRIRSPIGIGKTAVIAGLLLVSIPRAGATITAHYVTDPSSCPVEDSQFPGQKCPSGLQICGVNGSSIPQCYDNAEIAAPLATATSNTQYTASIGGGYIIDCFTTPLDSAAPYCDVNGAWLCNRDNSCYSAPVNKATTCTGPGTYTCGDCRSGYQDCDGVTTTCEVQTSVTNYPTGANNNYGASCAAQCDTNYLDCDSSGAGVGNGCEILDGGTCDTHAIYDGCSAAAGNCQCSTDYYDCNSDLGLSGDGCEIHQGDACTSGGVAGTYNGCTCVPEKTNFETSTLSTFSAADPLLWGTQLGTGKLLSFSNAIGERFAVFNSGAIKIGTTTTEEAGIIRWTGSDFEGYTGTEWESMTTGGGGTASDSRYVDTAGDTMTGSLILGNSALLSASGTLKTESGIVLNAENAAQDSVLVFGNALGQETLKFLNTEHRFEFSDDVAVAGRLSASGGLSVDGQTYLNNSATVTGDLTVSGLINGIDLASLSASADNTHLKVSSGAGLTVSIAAGDYRLGGVTTRFTGTSGILLADDTTNYVYLTSTGLTVTQATFPTDRAVLQLASVVTAGGGVSSVTDRRVFNSNDSQHTDERVYEPTFEGAAYDGDGSENVGQLTASHSGALMKNYYQWTSTRPTLQDYDVVLKVPLSSDFISWATIPITVAYRSSSADSANNRMDISVYDTAGNAVTLVGSSTELASATWTTTTLSFAGAPTWTPGGELLLKIKLSPKDTAQMQLGFVKIQQVEKLSE